MIIVPETEIEALVASRAILNYRKRIKDIKNQENFLRDKKIHFGNYVVIIKEKVLNNRFNIFCNDVGKVVGYDLKNNYYRIYFNENNPYVGIPENELKIYEGKIPNNLIEYNPYDLKFMYV